MLLLLIMLLMLLATGVSVELSDLFSISLVSSYPELIFSLVVSIITLMVSLYIKYYMMYDKFIKRFIFMVILFYLSMVILLTSQSLFTLFIGWDGLGISSYWLVIYYMNYKSNNAGMITMLSNRMGDFMLMFIIMYMMFAPLTNLCFFMLLFMIVSITKSAQFPFSSWLPLAMAAPTPVSALVHSSTLVTAGMILLFRFYDMIVINSMFLFILIISVITMMFSSIMGTVEFDFKKVIALSTLSQVSMMMFSLMLNMKILSFFHLVTHAFFKSLLFLVAGVIIHSMWSSQYINMINNSMIKSILPSLFFSIAGLCGVMFFSGYYSKDIIMEQLEMSVVSLFMMTMLLLSIVMTTIYSLRMINCMMVDSMIIMETISLSMITIIPLLVLSLMTMLTGLTMYWSFNNISFMIVDLESKVWLLLTFIYGIIIFFIMKVSLNLNYIKFMVTMLMLNKMTTMINSMVMFIKASVSKLLEKGWMSSITIQMESLVHVIISMSQLMSKSKLSMFSFLMTIIFIISIL